MIHDVPQLTVATVSPHPALLARNLNNGPVAAHPSAHTQSHQLGFPSYQSLAHNSMESLPSTAVSSPGTAYSEYASSSGYESATMITHDPISPMSQAASNARPRRSKRGSASQGSISEAESKRSCAGLSADEFGFGFSAGCSKKCRKSGTRCKNPEDCRRKSEKTNSEKDSRKGQSASYQYMEDLLELYLGYKAQTAQMTGNRRKSGVAGRKQEVMDAFIVLCEVLHYHALRGDLKEPGAPGLKEEILKAIDDNYAKRSDRKLSLNSLMAADTATGERPCPGLGQDQKCSLHDDYVQCRKYTRGLEFQRNTRRIRRDAERSRL